MTYTKNSRVANRIFVVSHNSQGKSKYDRYIKRQDKSLQQESRTKKMANLNPDRYRNRQWNKRNNTPKMKRFEATVKSYRYRAIAKFIGKTIDHLLLYEPN